MIRAGTEQRVGSLTTRLRAVATVAIAVLVFPLAILSEVAAQQPNAAASADTGKLNVLILGDSLALCGFGKRLDERFRADPRVSATYTYMACGTNPLSWLKQKPYTSIKAPCGFWSIESAAGAKEPREMQDTYGMKHNQVPKAYVVPKLEDLLERDKPDILVVQTGSNLFGLFPDAKTVRPAQHGPALQHYLLPFKEKATTAPSTVRKIYWVSPPVSGRVGMEVQDFVLDQTRKQLTPTASVIDSRKLVTYPYKHMDADKEHFLGEEMTQWADRVFEVIETDLAAQPIASLRPLSETAGQGANPPEMIARAQAVTSPVEVAARAQPVGPAEIPARAQPVAQPPVAPHATPVPRPEPVQVKATLVFKSKPIPLPELLPYQESLVGYVYQIDKVLRGQYNERQILVMHPAHIALKEQKLEKFRIGKRYKLRLDRMEGTLWDTAKAKDESNLINLEPYMRLEDLKKHPGERTR